MVMNTDLTGVLALLPPCTQHVHRDARVLGLTLALRDNRHLLSNQYFWLGIGS